MVSWQAVSSRLLTARLKYKHSHISIIVGYEPTEDHAANDKDMLSSALEALMLSVSPHDQVVVLKDFNAVTGTDRTGFKAVIGNCGSGTTNDNSLRLLSMLLSTNLTVFGSMVQMKGHPPSLMAVE